jgi:alpha-glucosidase
LPQDTWFTFGTRQTAAGPQTVGVSEKLDEIPLYVRAGTILPLGPVLQYTSQPTTDPLEVQIYPGRDGSFDLVEDDGSTLAYKKGATRTTHFAWSETGSTLSWTTDGSYKGDNLFHAFKAVLFSPKGPVKVDGSLDQPGSLTFP